MLKKWKLKLRKKLKSKPPRRQNKIRKTPGLQPRKQMPKARRDLTPLRFGALILHTKVKIYQ